MSAYARRSSIKIIYEVRFKFYADNFPEDLTQEMSDARKSNYCHDVSAMANRSYCSRTSPVKLCIERISIGLQDPNVFSIDKQTFVGYEPHSVFPIGMPQVSKKGSFETLCPKLNHS